MILVIIVLILTAACGLRMQMAKRVHTPSLPLERRASIIIAVPVCLILLLLPLLLRLATFLVKYVLENLIVVMVFIAGFRLGFASLIIKEALCRVKTCTDV
jgi:hypothetical protein